MVQDTSKRLIQMAERPGNVVGDEEACSPSLSTGDGSNAGNCGKTFTFKTEESSSSLDGDEDEDEDSGGQGWLACLLCGKANEDLPSDQPNPPLGKGVPYLCAACSQRFEVIQNTNPGDPSANGIIAEEVKAIVKLEEAEEELQVLGLGPRLRPGVRLAARLAARLRGGVAHAAQEADDGGLGHGGTALECNECAVKFEDAASLERHAMTHMAHMGQGEHDDQGELCIAEDLDEDGDGDGEREERPLPFQCEVCTRGFSRKDKLKLHLMIHSGEKPLKCELCGKAFLRRDHLKNHMRTHSRPPAAPRAKAKTVRAKAQAQAAPDQDRDADAEAPLTVDERPFGCEVCRRMFSRKDNLASHMRTHTGERPFGCSLCDKRFAEKCALKRHMVVHTQEKMYLCGVCGRSFARKGHLTEHVWLHDEVKPFSCAVCGKAFARDRKLKSHMMTHSGERPFKCGVCDRAFARKDNLRSHQSLHFGASRPPRPRSSRPGSRPSDPDHSQGGDGSLGLDLPDVPVDAMQTPAMQSPAMQTSAMHDPAMQAVAMEGMAVPTQLLGHQLMAPMGVSHLGHVDHPGYLGDLPHLGQVGHGHGHGGDGHSLMASTAMAGMPGVLLGMGMGMGMMPS